MAENNPDSRALPKRKLRIIIFASIIVAAFICVSLADGRGQVQDTVTGEPIADATVRLTCSVTNFIHGSSVYREIEIVTDSNGNYDFSFFDVFGCVGSHVSASKVGYSQNCGWCLNYWNPSLGVVPIRKLLTKDQDKTTIEIQGVTPRETPGYPHNKEPNVRYNLWYAGFVEAKSIAKADQEIEHVRSIFCTTLVELYSQLTQDEKESLDQESFSYFERAMPVIRKHNFEKEVAKFCVQTN